MLPFPLFVRAVDLAAYDALAADVGPGLPARTLPVSALPWVERAWTWAEGRAPLERAAIHERLLPVLTDLGAGRGALLGDGWGDTLHPLLAASAFPGFTADAWGDAAGAVVALGEDDGGLGLWLRHTSPPARALFESPDLAPAPLPLGHDLRLVRPPDHDRVRRALTTAGAPPSARAHAARLERLLDRIEDQGWAIALSDL